MRLLKKGVTILLVLAVFISTSQISVAAESAPAGVADITDEEVTRLVKEAYNKFCNQSAIGLTLLHDTESFSFSAYDSANGIGVHNETMSFDYLSPREVSTDYPMMNWVDQKNLKEYYSDTDSTGSMIYMFYPHDKDSIQNAIETIFTYVYTVKKTGFVIADEYHYAGNSWEYGPTGERHLCYIAEVPDTDRSLYQPDQYYLPKRIYIGVNDGMIYRIDEEYNRISVETVASSYYWSYYYYPQSLEIPEYIKKSAILSNQYIITKDSVNYSMNESASKPGSFIMQATEIEGYSKSTSLKIPSSLKVLGKAYKIEGILPGAFSSSALKTADTGANIREIGPQAFAGCKELKKVTIGKNIKDIGKNTFKGCSKLETIIIKNKKMRKYVASKKGRKAVGIDKKVVVK